ncbi:MAG: MBL fold metallo-hydrolase [Alphaproteobacteria bacterium]
MKITILGSGSSGGVPLIGPDWGRCDPSNPKNRRSRSSILVQEKETTILVDTPPEIREQLLRVKLNHLDAVLYTHAHADHLHGIDDMRSINRLLDGPLDLYADPKTLSIIRERFSYIFEGRGNRKGGIFKPWFTTHTITAPFQVGNINVIPFEQDHGYSKSTGFRFGDIAFSTDVLDLDENAFKILEGVDTWILDCVKETPHPTHTHLAKSLAWVERVKPRRTILHHMDHSLGYEYLASILPKGVEPAYDGMVVEV